MTFSNVQGVVFFCGSLLCLLALAAQGQELAAGWSKAHADLRNSNVHPTTGGLRSLENTEFVELFNEGFENSGAAHDQQGNTYVSLNFTLHQLNVTGQWKKGPLHTEEHYGHPTVTDDGKVVVLSEHSVEVFDLASQTAVNASWDTIDWYLYGSSAVVVEDLIYVLNSDGEMMVFDFDLQLLAFNNASRHWGSQDNFVEFCTPATDGEGHFFFFTESNHPSVVFAIAFPENELLWNRSMTELDPLPSLRDGPADYKVEGSPSLSEDGSLLYMVLADGGVVALNTDNGDVVWATAISDLVSGTYTTEKQVPTHSPVDGALITHWRHAENDSVVLVGLDPLTGEQVHILEAFQGNISRVNSPAAVSADGLYYLSVSEVFAAIDLASFEVVWSRQESAPASEQSMSIAADGSVYVPQDWWKMSVLRCKENFAVDGTGTCQQTCANPNARFIGRNLCGYDCGDSVAVLFPLQEPLCHACLESEFWSSEELACQACEEGFTSPAGSIGSGACEEIPPSDSSSSSSSSSEDDSGSNRLHAWFL